MEQKAKKDCYAEITNAIIADLEKGVRPWIKPWDGGNAIPCRPLRITGEPYRGINVMLLWSAAHEHGFRNAHWLTYQQAVHQGGHVRKGEKSTTVVFSGTLTRTEQDDNGEEHEKVIPFLKAYSVFNIDQTEGLSDKYRTPAATAPSVRENARNEQVDRFIANTGVEVIHGGDRACYSPLEDRIYMPNIERFKDSDAYGAVILHEAAHATMRDDRCPRKFRPSVYGVANYAREELIAELGAAFLCADLQISLTPRPDHAEYIAGWLEVLRIDKRAIFQAAATAQRAVDFLNALQDAENSPGDEQSIQQVAQIKPDYTRQGNGNNERSINYHAL
jgi:antirestriction protein ArdC